MPWTDYVKAAGIAAVSGILGFFGGHSNTPPYTPQKPAVIELLVSSPGSKVTTQAYVPGAIVGLRGNSFNFGDGFAQGHYVPSASESRPSTPPTSFQGIWLDQGNAFNASGSGKALGYSGPGYTSTDATPPATVVIDTVLIKGAILERMEVGEETLQSMNVKEMNVTSAGFGQVEIAGPAAPSGKNGSSRRKRSK